MRDAEHLSDTGTHPFLCVRSTRSRYCVGACVLAQSVCAASVFAFAPAGCALGTQFTLFWASAVVLTAIYVLSRAFICCVERYAQYPRRDAARDTICWERVCAFSSYLWACVGLALYLTTTWHERCWVKGSSILAVCFLLTAIIMPVTMVYFDRFYSAHLLDIESEAREWQCSRTELSEVAQTRIDGSPLLDDFSPPIGFRRGVGSSDGNNCWISSLVQLLRGAPARGFEHEAECGKIRRFGVSIGAWAAGSTHIDADSDAVEAVCRVVQKPVPNVVIFAGPRGEMCQDIPSTPGAPIVFMFNARGLHYDPLWPVGGAALAGDTRETPS